MSFIQEAINYSQGIWDECVATPFVQELKNGTLPMEKFKNYMIQDSIYLKHYARVYGNAIYHSETLKDIQIFYEALNFVNDTESAVRIDYLKQFNMTDDDIEFITPLPENQNYIDFMVEIAQKGNVCEILMAVLPCMMSYDYIGRKIVADSISQKSRYRDFIQDYANEHYEAICHRWGEYADTKCADLSIVEKENLKLIFEKASLLELDFWKMAYR